VSRGSVAQTVNGGLLCVVWAPRFSCHFVLRRPRGLIIKISRLMLHREMIAVCSQINIKHVNTLCGQNVEFVSVKSGGI
jgi:hypothetical protein